MAMKMKDSASKSHVTHVLADREVHDLKNDSNELKGKKSGQEMMLTEMLHEFAKEQKTTNDLLRQLIAKQ